MGNKQKCTQLSQTGLNLLHGAGDNTFFMLSAKKCRLSTPIYPNGILRLRLNALPIEFDEKLWHAVVDHVTVYHDDRLVYSLKDGTEITIEL